MAAVKLLAESAPAKINLFLRVVGKRADRYHELDSIFLPISLADTVRIELRPGNAPVVTLRCSDPALADSETNLAARAALAFMREFKFAAQISIDLEKKIPVGAGLGGGSSDAGTVLRMLARLFRIDEVPRLRRIAIQLGADVPFFLEPRPARVGGIGERLVPVPGIPEFPVVVVAPPVEVSTASIFSALTRTEWSGVASDADVASIVRGEVSDALAVNDLAAVAIRSHPEIGRLRSLMRENGARASQMTGSGGGVFGIFASRDEAEQAAIDLRRRAPESRVFVTQSVSSA